MHLDVGNGHRIYYEEYGNPKGIKILFLHGGPGLGFSDNDKAFFDPEKFHVVFIDQRGCGRSTPKGALNFNTTQYLISDINIVLNHLEIESVTLFGGSWGATLAILYAAEFPKSVNKLILRGFFPATKECTDIYLRGGIQTTHPENWERVSSLVPENEKDKVAEYFFEVINSDSEKSQALGYEWARYGLSLSRKQISEKELDQILVEGAIDIDSIKIELNYALNGFFIPEGYVYEQATKIGNIPIVIIHGSHDYICPVGYAEKLTSKFTKPKFILVDAGHSTFDVAIKEALFEELDQL